MASEVKCSALRDKSRRKSSFFTRCFPTEEGTWGHDLRKGGQTALLRSTSRRLEEDMVRRTGGLRPVSEKHGTLRVVGRTVKAPIEPYGVQSTST